LKEDKSFLTVYTVIKFKTTCFSLRRDQLIARTAIRKGFKKENMVCQCKKITKFISVGRVDMIWQFVIAWADSYYGLRPMIQFRARAPQRFSPSTTYTESRNVMKSSTNSRAWLCVRSGGGKSLWCRDARYPLHFSPHNINLALPQPHFSP